MGEPTIDRRLMLLRPHEGPDRLIADSARQALIPIELAVFQVDVARIEGRAGIGARGMGCNQRVDLKPSSISRSLASMGGVARLPVGLSGWKAPRSPERPSRRCSREPPAAIELMGEEGRAEPDGFS
jgi:hypothetical protein